MATPRERTNSSLRVHSGRRRNQPHLRNSRFRVYASRGAGNPMDFGTGYSSLAYIKKFEIDYIKIDQTFTKSLGAASDALVLCEAIIVMAHKLDIKVIAEGVETPLQRDLLLAAGCDFAQGYLFSKPLPADEFDKLLSEQLSIQTNES